MTGHFSRTQPKVALLRRADYRPPEWLVPETRLEFELDEDRIRVRARLEVVRNGRHGAPLRLDGEGLKLIAVMVDGKPAAHRCDRTGLTVRLAGDSATVETLAEFVPGSEQRGLFALDGLLCTQCEPEGFRRIAFFPDRPDVLSRFAVRIAADAERFPILLSNGNPAGRGAIAGGRHWVEWHDPVPKPCYLFALVAGDLAAARDRFVTASGRPVDLAIWGRPADLPNAAHAMASLSAAMAWDEATWGRGYDLDALNLVAVRGYAFGAVEAKGLNLFDASLLLADPETATDADLDAVTALVGHEYFHNWSGNRVTIRDWFELGLKEGLTVFRDQQFSAAMGSAAVKRIEDVAALRAAQFAQDAGPDAHPVRPETCRSIGDLYTATIYTKGAELVRMLATMLGPDAFRAGLDRYFARHDGGAATVDDLLAAIADGLAPDGFARWYAATGTPRVTARLDHDPASATATVTLEQQGDALPIPLRTALFGPGGKSAEQLLILDAPRRQFRFAGIAEPPMLSINRGFSAPVRIDAGQNPDALAWLAMQDDDSFARHEAMQSLMRAAATGLAGHDPAIAAARHMLDGSDAGLAAVTLAMPAPAEFGDADVDPAALRAGWFALRTALGEALAPEWRAQLARAPEDKGARALRNVALGYLVAGGAADAGAIALRQLVEGPAMTARLGGLRALADSDLPERREGLARFHRRWRDDPGLLDRWFGAQALSLRDDTIEAAPRLLAHPDFTLAHPTRLSAVAGAFGTNFFAFHHPGGRGYAFVADVTLAADRIDARAATSLVRPLLGWRRFAPETGAAMQRQLERILAAPISDALRARVAAGLGLKPVQRS